MKSWQKQQQAGPAQASSAPTMGQVPAAPIEEPKPAPAASSVTFKDGRIELVRPLIELSGHIFVDPSDSSTQVRKLTPDRAFIADGVVVIEEYGIWFPLSNVTIGRKTK